MEINLEEKSKELKEFVGQFETRRFLGELSQMMQDSIRGLSSPKRQLYYLAGLNVSSSPEKYLKLKPQFSDDEFEHMKVLLNEIEKGYEQLFDPKEGEEIDNDWISKRKVTMSSFFEYFNQGQLNYEEQVIERIFEYFSPFTKEIRAHFGVDVQDFIDFYNFVDTFSSEFMANLFNKRKDQQAWFKSNMEFRDKGGMPWELDSIPNSDQNFFDFIADKGQILRFSSERLLDKFGKEKTDVLLKAITCTRQETDFLYYNERNPLHLRPILHLGNNEFQVIESIQIIHAIYNVLFDFCDKNQTKVREKFYQVRGHKLEDKIEKILQAFLGKKVEVHKGYFTQDAREQDLLFLIDGLALIVEAKSAKKDEPKENPSEALVRLESRFKGTIQKGYDQAYRVKEKFIDKSVVRLYRNQKLGRHYAEIETKRYYRAFSIIVTLERYGQMQTNLDELLQLWEDDAFPWSVCIDDLEIFLLQLAKLKKKPSYLADFLTLREELHGRIISSDELEICGAYLEGKIDRRILRSEIPQMLGPDHAMVFDRTYHTTGLGFQSEKNIDLVTKKKLKSFPSF